MMKLGLLLVCISVASAEDIDLARCDADGNLPVSDASDTKIPANAINLASPPASCLDQSEVCTCHRQTDQNRTECCRDLLQLASPRQGNHANDQSVKWISGAGKKWKYSTTPGPYDACGSYDLCTLSYASDGTADNPVGKQFDFNAPDGPPYTMTIDMGSPASFSSWRLAMPNDCYAMKHAKLQYKNGAGTFVDVPGSNLLFSTGSWSALFLNTTFTAPVRAQVWKVLGEDKLRDDAHSCHFQVYISEVQFGVEPPKPKATTYSCEVTPTSKSCIKFNNSTGAFKTLEECQNVCLKSNTPNAVIQD
jgi:hypothetical protein